ncbi:alcohol dehydrogenase AdhP [Campylobacter hepaticus]|uniref:alcohol dehydrogenase n=1 Tax=Campylobacter hepaticus TaxID=1813019 RepID=A0A6A7JR17_9BACT|nr:alcohol dehydrogenase AdhP [Campylobacter hepaticus]AXP08323.1 alcohol dehydrogenase AdhP [Campylobacter hepaticus]MPV53561.1 alcohol dehydrogenase AdhP [Campylobacter hepaticus]MPV62492.1 alcohol dehydrogenase AdhP [Campylobacter hepaticus]MPV76873.1 alcohol dehydrogenase AdhP [Campylobacter hepaticus]MPV78219.1 alcohol dehydrogenase AdhP [Campylobacter hepaticus]
MSKTMKAAIVKEFGGPLLIEEVKIPKVGKRQILVKIEACGVCHTDLHAVNGDWPIKPKLPLIPGHEGVGYVVEVGEGVNHIKEGDAVGIPWLYSACGHCEHCMSGWETLCQSQQNAGYSVNGGFAQYALADANYVGILKKDSNFLNIAPILCAGVTVYKGLKMTQAKPGQWVSISGIGGLGHLAIQYAKVMGLNVAAIDISDDKLELAKKYGASVVANAKKLDKQGTIDKIKEETNGGTHGVLVTAVHPIAFKQAVGIVHRGGTIAMNGLPPGDFPVNIFNMILNGITIRGSIVGTRMDLQEAINFAEDEKVHAHITPAKLEDINDVFKKMKEGKIDGRMVLDFKAS